MHAADTKFSLGRSVSVRRGDDVTLMSAGSGLPDVMAAASLLEGHGLSVRVLTFPSIRPLDIDAITTAAKETRNIFTVEEHSVNGGFGSAVAEFLLESGIPLESFKRLGFPNRFTSKVGDQGYLRSYFKLDARGIAESVLTKMGRQ